MALLMRHPALDVEATCVDEAQFVLVHAEAGWELVLDDDGAPVTVPASGVPTAHLAPDFVDDTPDADDDGPELPSFVDFTRPDPDGAAVDFTESEED